MIGLKRNEGNEAFPRYRVYPGSPLALVFVSPSDPLLPPAKRRAGRSPRRKSMTMGSRIEAVRVHAIEGGLGREI